MANVLLTSSAPGSDSRPYAYDELNRMKQSAERDKYGVHCLTDDPARADLILFVENCNTIHHYLEVRHHLYLKKYREKCFLFSKFDHPLPFLPGVYASIEKRWYDKQRTRAGGYLKAFGKEFIKYDPEYKDRDFLYSFMGSTSTYPSRKKLFALDHEAQYLLDTSQFWPYGELEEMKKGEFEQHYVDVSHRSKFILCPRGRGVSSMRLFESMCMGRAPVIIADDWVPPEGPDWDAFSLRVAEGDIAAIPGILLAHEHRAEEMGRRARQAWEDWFSVEAIFHWTVEACLDIRKTRRYPEALLRYRAFSQLLRPLHFRALVRKLLPSNLRRQLTSAL